MTLGITSVRQVERRLVEGLAFRYLAAGERIGNCALSAFRRRHGRALNDPFTQVLEWARSRGMVKLDRVAIDSTRVADNASRDRVDTEKALRDTRAQLRRQVRAWQQATDRDNAEPGGLDVAIRELNKALEQLPCGASFEDVAGVLGNSPELVRKHYGSGHWLVRRASTI